MSFATSGLRYNWTGETVTDNETCFEYIYLMSWKIYLFPPLCCYRVGTLEKISLFNIIVELMVLTGFLLTLVTLAAEQMLMRFGGWIVKEIQIKFVVNSGYWTYC